MYHCGNATVCLPLPLTQGKKNWAGWQVAGKHPITTPLNHFGTLAWVHLGTMRKHPHPRCWSKRPSIKTMSQPWAASAEGRVGGQSKQPAGGTSEWSGALKKLDRSEGHVRRVENKWLMLQKHKMFLSMDSIGKTWDCETNSPQARAAVHLYFGRSSNVCELMQVWELNGTDDMSTRRWESLFPDVVIADRKAIRI